MSTRSEIPFARVAIVAALCVLAAACGRRDDGGTSAGGGTNPTTPAATTGPGGNTTTGMPAGVGSTGPSGSPTAGTTGDTAAGGMSSSSTTVAGGTGSTGSATVGGTGAAKTAALSDADRKFVTDAAAGGMYEVQVSQLAADKAKDPKVKAYGEKLVKDHSSANDELKSFASAHSVTLPTTLPADKKAQLDKLSKASGADFDKQFVKMVGMDDHKKDIAMFEKASKAAKNAELKAWIDKTLPTLKEHHAMAEKLPRSGGS